MNSVGSTVVLACGSYADIAASSALLSLASVRRLLRITFLSVLMSQPRGFLLLINPSGLIHAIRKVSCTTSSASALLPSALIA